MLHSYSFSAVVDALVCSGISLRHTVSSVLLAKLPHRHSYQNLYSTTGALQSSLALQTFGQGFMSTFERERVCEAYDITETTANIFSEILGLTVGSSFHERRRMNRLLRTGDLADRHCMF